MSLRQGSEEPEKAQTVAKSRGRDLVRYDQNLHLIQRLSGSINRVAKAHEELSSCCTPRFMGGRFSPRTSAAVGPQASSRSLRRETRGDNKDKFPFGTCRSTGHQPQAAYRYRIDKDTESHESH